MKQTMTPQSASAAVIYAKTNIAGTGSVLDVPR